MILNGRVHATHVDSWRSQARSQVERLHPKSEPVPRCCLSDRWGKIQIRENQENAKNRRSMHPMERPHVVQHHQPKQHINPVDGELIAIRDVHRKARERSRHHYDGRQQDQPLMSSSLFAQSERCPSQHRKADLFEKRDRLEAENAKDRAHTGATG